MRPLFFFRSISIFLICWLTLACAVAEENPVLTETVITAVLPGRTISALITQLRNHGEFKSAIMLMPDTRAS